MAKVRKNFSTGGGKKIHYDSLLGKSNELIDLQKAKKRDVFQRRSEKSFHRVSKAWVCNLQHSSIKTLESYVPDLWQAVLFWKQMNYIFYLRVLKPLTIYSLFSHTSHNLKKLFDEFRFWRISVHAPNSNNYLL